MVTSVYLELEARYSMYYCNSCHEFELKWNFSDTLNDHIVSLTIIIYKLHTEAN